MEQISRSSPTGGDRICREKQMVGQIGKTCQGFDGRDFNQSRDGIWLFSALE